MKILKITIAVILMPYFLISIAFAVDIIPHQAHYSLDIEKINIAGSNIYSSGDFFLHVEKTCDSWNLATQFSFQMDGIDGLPLNMVMLSKWQETFDGNSMHFNSQTLINGATVLHYEGVVNKGKGGTDSQLYLTKPGQSLHMLPSDIYFPMSATIKSLYAMSKGIKTQNYLIYDGSGEKSVRVSDLYLGKARAVENIPDILKPYIKGQGFHVISSFFDDMNTDNDAISTHSSDIYQNGITTRLKIANAELTATGIIDDFKILKIPNCD